jgi:hypothetical protein
MIHLLDESSRKKLCNLLIDGLALLLVEAAQTLLYRLGAWLDPQGMFGDFPWNAWHIRGFPREDVTVRVEEVDERAFLFGRKVRANAQHLAIEADGIDGDILGVLCGLKGARWPLRVGHLLDCRHRDGGKLLGGDGRGSELAALHFALVRAME